MGRKEPTGSACIARGPVNEAWDIEVHVLLLFFRSVLMYKMKTSYIYNLVFYFLLFYYTLVLFSFTYMFQNRLTNWESQSLIDLLVLYRNTNSFLVDPLQQLIKLINDYFCCVLNSCIVRLIDVCSVWLICCNKLSEFKLIKLNI